MNDALLTAQPAAAADPSSDRAERHMRVLEELAGIGMELVRALRRQVVDEGVVGDGDPGLTYSRLARAVRQTLALEAKIDEDRRASVAKAEAERAEKAAEQARVLSLQRQDRIAKRKDEVQDALERAIEDEAPDNDIDRLLSDLNERLDDDSDDDDFADRPIGELINTIRRDLGLPPDPSLWDDGEAAPVSDHDAPAPPASAPALTEPPGVCTDARSHSPEPARPPPDR